MKPKPKHDGYCAFDPEGKIIKTTFSHEEDASHYSLVFMRGKEVGGISFTDAEERLRKEGYTVRKVCIVPIDTKGRVG